MFASGLRGVIFDCDGVMIDSVAANRIFFDRCLAYYGLPPMTDEQAAYCNMSTSRQGLEHILPERAKKDIPRFGRDIVNYDREILPFIKLYPGFLGFADFLHENGVRMAVLTNRTDNGMKSILDFFSLPSYFNPVVTASCGFPKPQPGGARLILSEWGVGAGDVLYVGDSDVDRRTAEACRMPFAAMNPKEILPWMAISAWTATPPSGGNWHPIWKPQEKKLVHPCQHHRRGDLSLSRGRRHVHDHRGRGLCGFLVPHNAVPPGCPRARETDGTRLFPRAQMDALRLLRGTGFFTRGCYCRTRAF